MARVPLDVDGSPVAWREAGTGPSTVLLLHGLGGSRISWEPQLVGLSGQRRVVAWDMPGYGASTPLPQQQVGFHALADAASALIGHLGVAHAHVVGISMGGMVAQYLAHRHPAKVRSLTLLSSSPAFGLDGTLPEQWRAARLAPLDQGLEPADFAEQVLRAIAGPHISDEALAGQIAAMRRVTAAGLRRSIDCLVTHDTRPILHEIATPTLCLVGELDEETPPSYSQYLAEHIPGARLEVVPSAGHLLNAEAPDAVNELISAHLDAVEATPS
mgnify:CR=1 FL=1